MRTQIPRRVVFRTCHPLAAGERLHLPSVAAINAVLSHNGRSLKGSWNVSPGFAHTETKTLRY